MLWRYPVFDRIVCFASSWLASRENFLVEKSKVYSTMQHHIRYRLALWWHNLCSMQEGSKSRHAVLLSWAGQMSSAGSFIRQRSVVRVRKGDNSQETA